MFSGFYVWSKALGINSNDFCGRRAESDRGKTRRLDYSVTDYDRPHNFVLNAIYQTPVVTTSELLGILANEWRIFRRYRWTSGRPYTVGSDPGYRRAEPHRS